MPRGPTIRSTDTRFLFLYYFFVVFAADLTLSLLIFFFLTCISIFYYWPAYT